MDTLYSSRDVCQLRWRLMGAVSATIKTIACVDAGQIG
jgi:hypothetical protein